MILLLWSLAIFSTFTSAALTGSGNSTRGWNCCKPSCSWEGKANVTSPVQTCNKDNTPLNDSSATSACSNGTAYGCADMSPWQVDNATAYGYATTVITGKQESDWCCTCFELTFTSGPATGRKMTVQSVDTLPDAGFNQFSLSVRTRIDLLIKICLMLTCICRFPAAVLGIRTRVRNSIPCLHQAGVKSMEASPQCPLVTVILLR